MDPLTVDSSTELHTSRARIKGRPSWTLGVEVGHQLKPKQYKGLPTAGSVEGAGQLVSLRLSCSIPHGDAAPGHVPES